MGVAVAPGATPLAVMRVPLSSFASTVVITSTAAFVAAYAPNPGLSPPTPDDEKVMIRPPPPRTRRFAASRQQRNVPLAFTPNIWSKLSSVVSTIDGYRASLTAAAVTSMCKSGPKGLDLGGAGHIGGDRYGPGAAGVAIASPISHVDRLRQLLRRARVADVADDNACAKGGEVGRHRRADATCAARHDRHAAFQRPQAVLHRCGACSRHISPLSLCLLCFSSQRAPRLLAAAADKGHQPSRILVYLSPVNHGSLPTATASMASTRTADSCVGAFSHDSLFLLASMGFPMSSSKIIVV
ncbi:hypothetical protein MUK42_37755 [Musa troglodytarum]|uniref:Uncharacterized protein n=1 Tax=Musa troglodytarum TaxID=320322 RepID=A0A9E7G8V6_9LILI|nr:hypothetical protein MUK42_37755 [Musa troglodytarum]